MMLLLAVAPLPATAADGKPAPLRLAAKRFGITPREVIKSNSAKLPKKAEIAGPLKATVTLLQDADTTLCCVNTDWINMSGGALQIIRRALSSELKIPEDCVILFSSHNHSDTSLVAEGTSDTLNDIGAELLNELLKAVRELPSQLQPVEVWWGVGHEDRITYNRKGRRADGSTFLMREEDRVRVATDFRGDIDPQAPIVVFKNLAGEPVAAWIQFTGHPVTSFSPENPVVFGDYPQVACDILGRSLGTPQPIPVAFFQGCAGDVNSKEMFRGGVKRATEFGELLAESCLQAVTQLRKSDRNDLAFETTVAELPLAPLPPIKELQQDLAEIEEFIRRARSGDEEALFCVGMNFPHDLSPQYRAGLMEPVRNWYLAALEWHTSNSSPALPTIYPVQLWVMRVGDVGLVGIPCEPFLGIGRQIRAGSSLPLTIPCGYANHGLGYIPDGPNIADREYMSSYFYRYSARNGINFRPPLAPPGGDVIATEGVKALERLSQ
ncbi:hypothetical protein [Planctomicrobium sp. SH664]|uniref:hypothetical protein n=1 Tax=Planctomicrobium sp. SH664 TaxID=3448125 RepID=UPI003F5C4593